MCILCSYIKEARPSLRDFAHFRKNSKVFIMKDHFKELAATALQYAPLLVAEIKEEIKKRKK